MEVITSRSRLVLILVFVSPCAPLEAANPATILVTGDAAAGDPNAFFGGFGSAAMNADGKVVFTAELQHGAGGVGVGNDDGVWLSDGAATSLLAREGTGDVPNVAGANFSSFHAFAIDEAGDVVLRAALEENVGGVTSANREGLWKFTGGADSLITRTGSSIVPGVASGTFAQLMPKVRLGGSGQTALTATLNPGGGVNSDNDKGVWSYDSLGGTLVAREGTSVPPGVASNFKVFNEPRVNDNHEIAFRASLEISGGVVLENSVAIWKYNDLGGELIAREGVGNVPGVAATSFTQMGEPVLNGSGQLAFHSKLTNVGGVDPNNDAGVWVYTGTSGTLLARTGSSGIAGVPGANFETLHDPLLSDSGSVLVKAELVVGPGGVTAADNLGLWTFDGAASSLVARTGSGGVPDLPAASFSDFQEMAMNDEGRIAVKALLQQGGGVDPNNDSGLWLFDPSGKAVLVAREGGPLAGRTIAALDFLEGSGGNDGLPTGLNQAGHLAFQADFTNGDSGLFLFTYFTADFDGDGDVDQDDLTHPTLGWEARYGVDLNGGDFLAWQQQFGSSVGPLSTSALAVPEPTAALLLALGLFVNGCRHRNRCS